MGNLRVEARRRQQIPPVSLRSRVGMTRLGAAGLQLLLFQCESI